MSSKENVTRIDHPLLQNLLTLLRDKRTEPYQFRRILERVSTLMIYEACRDLNLSSVAIETPMESIDQAPVLGEELLLVSIMRAGNGMLDSALNLLPRARAGHIGIYRDKFIGSTVEYFFRLPEQIQSKKVLLLDPLLATGDTAVAAVKRLKECGVGPIRLVCLLASPEGLAHLKEAAPETSVYCLSVERGLDDDGYILPGLGDAGDRLYGTVN